MRRVESLQCPAYYPPILAFDHWESDTGMSGGIVDRADIDYARQLIGRQPTESEEKVWTPDGWCTIPKHEPYVSPAACMCARAWEMPTAVCFDDLLDV